MSKHDSNTNGGGRKSPPPIPAIHPPSKRSKTAEFRGGAIRRPSTPPGRPEGAEPIISPLVPAPDGAKTTQSLKTPKPRPPVENEGQRRSEPLEAILNATVRGNTLVPPPPKEAAEKAAEEEKRFLRYGTALYRVSEISGENWTEWLTDPALMREKVGKAVETLKGRRTESENYAADYQMLRAFYKEISDDKKLNEYLLWMRGREKSFAIMAQVYADLSMGPLTPYIEVLDACEERIRAGGRGSGDASLRIFSGMVGDIREYEGTDYNYGELYKKMFDAWYVRKASEAMVKVYENAGIANERDSALLRVGELIQEIGDLREANRRLVSEAGAKGVPDAVMREVHGMREELIRQDGKNSALSTELSNERQRARDLQASVDALEIESNAVKCEYRKQIETTGKVQEENGRLREENEKSRGTINILNEKLEEKSADVANMRGELSRSQEANTGLMERVRELVAKVDAYEKRMEELEGRISLMDSQMSKLQEDKARMSEELALAKEPDLMHRPTMVSGTFEVPEEVRAAGPAAPVAAPKEDSAIMDLRSLMGAAVPAAPQPEKTDLLYGVTDVDEEVGAALEAGFAAATVEGGEEKIVVEQSGEARRDRSDRDAATQVSLVPAAEAARMGKVAEATAPITAEPPTEEIPANVPEITQPIVDIEKESREFEQAQEAVGLWGTTPGKAVKAIFAYGFAGKGQLPSKPVSRIVELPSISESEAYERAKLELEGEKQRFTKAMAEYNAWYNKLGRQLNTVRRETLSAAERVSEFGSRNRQKIKYAAAGVAGVGGLAAVAVVSYLTLSGTPAPVEVQNAISAQRPVAAQVAKAEPVAAPETGGKAAAAPKFPAYDLDAAISASLANNGISKIDSGKNAGPQLRALYNAAMKIEDEGQRFAALAYASNAMLDGNLHLKMDNTVVKNILIAAMGDGRNFAVENPGATLSVVKLVERSSEILDGSGGFKDARPTKGQEVLYKSILEWKGAVPSELLVEQVAPVQVAAPVVAPAEGTAVAGAVSAPVQGVATAAVAAAPAVAFDMSKVAENAFAKNSIQRDGHPREIYKKAMALSNIEERLAILAETSDRLYGSKELQHKMSEVVIAQIIIDAMDTAVEFGSVEGQDLGRKKAALEIVKRLSTYVGPKGEFDRKEPSKAFALKVRQARELAITLEGDVKAMEAASMRGSPTASSGVAPKLPETVLEGAEPAFSMGGVSDAYIDKTFQVNGLSKTDPPKKIYEASWNMKNEERFAVLTYLYFQMRENPGMIPPEENGLRVSIILSAVEAAQIVADTPRLFGKNEFASKAGQSEVLLEAEDMLAFLGKPGGKWGNWEPEQAEKWKKLKEHLRDQLDHRQRQLSKTFREDEKKIEEQEKKEADEARRKARKEKKEKAASEKEGSEKKTDAPEDNPYGG